ncbi:DUF4492 domain-containing protein [bacterium]|nr:DUF4492 domain-containing protein [bacterium]
MIFRKGFWKNSTIWHKLFFIVSIKMIFMFIIIKPLFFPNFMKTNFNSTEKKNSFMIKEITNIKDSNSRSDK